VQNSVRLDDRSEPEPDLALLRSGYADQGRHPTAADVLLLVEVADAMLVKDRDVKRPRYAAAGIPEVWIVSTQDRYVEVAREPGPGGYAHVQRWSARTDALLVPLALPDLPPLDIGALLAGLPE
jgi:Uma2 family endonuclease